MPLGSRWHRCTSVLHGAHAARGGGVCEHGEGCCLHLEPRSQLGCYYSIPCTSHKGALAKAVRFLILKVSAG